MKGKNYDRNTENKNHRTGLRRELRRARPIGMPIASIQSLSSEDWIDDRFAQPDRTGNGNALKEFIQQQTAEHTPPATVHANGNEFRVFYRDNAWHADGEVAGTRGRFSASDREALLSRLGQIKRPQNGYRELTKHEELQVIRACQAGDKLTAIGIYLAYSIGEARASKYDSPIEMMHDAALVAIMDKISALRFVGTTATHMP